ncbi:molybdate ABC transporter substrate-binding protein [Ferdinandcohnia quinoae]|uniref:Molybdate ABC transporter substrate-binding protein n=1 Tax=Fredinandcohnia quinoae TaxID=2918902 RepID=A0AAW5E9V3_9BACI|nr:molybdate ABC transporter substrate-binding protein [Fredinandcohnia sp. SECRCQ15]MCH1626186.1 molybdate ABC transporter substrate-binding protein [Fredinandcohnia sp. SECRCQ15]
MKRICNLLLFGIILVIFAGCSDQGEQQTKPVELTISAAASLENALEDIKTDFEKDNANIKLVFNFGGSGTLQQQISQGAPVDLFFSAATDKFEKLVEDGFIEKNKGINLVGNELVLITPKDSNKINSFEDLIHTDKIAIGTPETVPAGKYAKEALGSLKLWEGIEDKVVFAKDVRQVLTYVETNNVDAGIVYKTDAMISKDVKIIATASEGTHEPIIYPLGIIKDSKHLKEAQIFYDYLQGEKSIQVLESYGFKGLN